MDTGTFIAGLSTAIAFASAIVAYYAFHRSLRSATRPVLIFSLASDFRWKVENVGTGPAINIVVGDADSQGRFINVINCYPLAAGSARELAWIGVCWKLAAVYPDVFGATFTTICQGNRNSVVTRNEFPHWSPNSEQWLQEILAEGKQQSELTIEHLASKSAFELEIMRNELYARRGYVFKREDLADYFRRQHWYTPITRDYAAIHRQMTPAERYEAHFILNFQKQRKLRAVPLDRFAPPDAPQVLEEPRAF
jgi:hypothetical protein